MQPTAHHGAFFEMDFFPRRERTLRLPLTVTVTALTSPRTTADGATNKLTLQFELAFEVPHHDQVAAAGHLAFYRKLGSEKGSFVVAAPGNRGDSSRLVFGKSPMYELLLSGNVYSRLISIIYQKNKKTTG